MRENKGKTARINFTKVALAALQPPETGRVYLYDLKQPGLAVCLTSAGTRTFYVYRKLHGRPERIRLGVWPVMNVTEAREAAADAIGKIARGVDPNAPRRASRASPTFQEAFAEFLEQPTRTRTKRPRSPKTVKDYRLQFEAYLKDWHHRKLTSVTRADVQRLHNQLATASGKYLANRVLALVKAIYNTAIEQERVTANPAAMVRPFAEESRDRFLTADELPKFFAAVEAEPSEKVRDFVYLALYTGQRRSNVLAMRWEDLDLNRGVWTMPATKTGKHVVPLMVEAVAILKRREQDKGTCPYVLPGRHGCGHLQDPMRQWREILARAGIKDLRIHDLRRTLASWQTITGASLQVVGKTLGHSRPETTAIYGRLSDDPVRAAMATATAAMRATIQEGQHDEG